MKRREFLIAAASTVLTKPLFPAARLFGERLVNLRALTTLPFLDKPHETGYVRDMAAQAVKIFCPPQRHLPKIREMVMQGRYFDAVDSTYENAYLNGRLMAIADFLATDPRDRILLLETPDFHATLTDLLAREKSKDPTIDIETDSAGIQKTQSFFDLVDDGMLRNMILADFKYADQIIGAYNPKLSVSDQNQYQFYLMRKNEYLIPENLSPRERVFQLVESEYTYNYGHPTLSLVTDVDVQVRNMGQQYLFDEQGVVGSIGDLMNLLEGGSFSESSSSIGLHTRIVHTPAYQRLAAHLIRHMERHPPRNMPEAVADIARIPNISGFLGDFWKSQWEKWANHLSQDIFDNLRLHAAGEARGALGNEKPLPPASFAPRMELSEIKPV